jgi:hypothetical protein
MVRITTSDRRNRRGPTSADRAGPIGEQEIEMDYRDTPEEIFCSDVFLGHHGIRSTRRELLPLLGALPLTLSGTVALASQIKSETQNALPDVIRWSG